MPDGQDFSCSVHVHLVANSTQESGIKPDTRDIGGQWHVVHEGTVISVEEIELGVYRTNRWGGNAKRPKDPEVAADFPWLPAAGGNRASFLGNRRERRSRCPVGLGHQDIPLRSGFRDLDSRVRRR